MNEQTHLNIAALLSHVPLFSGLDTGEIAGIARGTREIHVDKGDILFHKGDSPTGFYLVVYGQVKLAISSSQGSEKVVDILSQGQTFGEAVMFMERPYMVYAQALKDLQLLLIAKSAILDELEKDPKLGRKMIASLSMRLHHLITDVEAYSLHSGRQRIIGYLLRETTDTDAAALTVTLPTNKGTIASRLNLTQGTFFAHPARTDRSRPDRRRRPPHHHPRRAEAARLRSLNIPKHVSSA